ncbi:sugar ABC transporter permease [Bacillus thuringiensis]|uniref:sugar ABC transporter permease n=1 Tax=Bacillus thuringiensis TaxID=1428 RepID=UPI0021D669C4|nr:sugar ABC transporter permease [Bacillus thuringiensis]MCU7667158.1 sugar ABC transporter permease [Bacillus thuringiensis]
MGNKKIFNFLRLALSYVFLFVLVFVVLFPIFLVIMGSFKSGNSITITSFKDFHFSLDHYRYLFEKTDYFQWYWNTLKIATGNMILSTVLVVTAGYAFSRYRFPGRKQGLMTMLVLQMFPSFMGMIAIFLLLDRVGLLNTHLGLIMVYAGGAIPFGAWLVKGYFDGIPRSLEEAARIDGAGHATVFFKVMMPLSKPILVFVAVNNFIGPWMDFIFARLVLTSTEKKTLAIGLFEMVTGRGNTQFTNFAAGAVLVAVPITILFIIFQKHIVDGLTAGANKG